MEMGWQFGGSLVAVLSLQLQVKGDTKTATKLPPNCHQTATKIPPTFHQNDTTMMAKIKKNKKTLPNMFHNATFVCGMKGFVNLIC